MNDTQISQLQEAITTLDVMLDDLIASHHSDEVAFPVGGNSRRCLTKGIDHLDDSRRWLRAAQRDALRGR